MASSRESCACAAALARAMQETMANCRIIGALLKLRGVIGARDRLTAYLNGMAQTQSGGQPTRTAARDQESRQPPQMGACPAQIRPACVRLRTKLASMPQQCYFFSVSSRLG